MAFFKQNPLKGANLPARPLKCAILPSVDTPDSNHDFIVRFRACCEEAGSIARLSEQIGVHKNTLRKYGQGTEPPRHNILKIADACNVSIEWLVSGRGAKRPGAVSQDGGTPNDSQDWIVARELLGCSVGGDGAISLNRGRPTVAIPAWIAERAFAGARKDGFDRLASFEVRDNLMAPDLLLNELAVCQVESTIHPTAFNGIFAFKEGDEVFARYAHRINDTQIVLSHWKTDYLGARWLNISELGTSVILLGRVLLAGAWVGLRHLSSHAQIPQVKSGPSLTLVVEVGRPNIESVKIEVEKLGGKAVQLNVEDDFILATLDQHNVAKLPLIPGVLRMSVFRRQMPATG